MKKLIYFTLGLAVMFTACSDDDDDDSKWINPPSTGATMTLQGGAGEEYAENSVFVDFSANEQQSVKRQSWHLAFNCGDDFGVFMNSTAISRAKEVVGINVEDVISEEALKPDSIALAMVMSEGNASMEIVDTFDKSISGTVIKEGKTYIYRNEVAGLSFYKIKVTKKDNNTYTVSYAKWNSADVKTVDVKKDTKYSTIGFSLMDGKTVVVEKPDWDILWGRNTYVSAMAPNAPSAMADIVFINNKGGVKAVQVLEKDIAYSSFTEASLASVTLLSDVGAIGDKWRGTGGMPPVMALKTDRYYIVQDGAGNIYKLKFLIMGANDGGTRGYPQLKFDLVKEAQ